MPDIYDRGKPHAPVQSLTGHFVGMQPSTAIGATLDKVWYRGDDVQVLRTQIGELEKQLALRTAALDIKTGRRPPKRMGPTPKGEK